MNDIYRKKLQNFLKSAETQLRTSNFTLAEIKEFRDAFLRTAEEEYAGTKGPVENLEEFTFNILNLTLDELNPGLAERMHFLRSLPAESEERRGVAEKGLEFKKLR